MAHDIVSDCASRGCAQRNYRSPESLRVSPEQWNNNPTICRTAFSDTLENAIS